MLVSVILMAVGIIGRWKAEKRWHKYFFLVTLGFGMICLIQSITYILQG